MVWRVEHNLHSNVPKWLRIKYGSFDRSEVSMAKSRSLDLRAKAMDSREAMPPAPGLLPTRLWRSDMVVVGRRMWCGGGGGGSKVVAGFEAMVLGWWAKIFADFFQDLPDLPDLPNLPKLLW